MTPPADDSAGGGRVSFSMTIEDGETVVAMHGDRDTAVIVRSASGERIYLPPEDFDRPAPAGGASEPADPDSPYQSASTDSPYQSASTDSPYQSAATDSSYQSKPTESPYQSASTDSPYQGDEDTSDRSSGEPSRDEGLSPTADGYRIRHPEPATDVRVLR